MKKLELDRLRDEFKAALDQFYMFLAGAREACLIDERVTLLDQAIAARSRALARAKDFLETV